MITIAKRGPELIQDPSPNKATAFAEAERRSLGLIGPVPDVTKTIRQHVYKPEYQTLV
jgi:malate dehydrogenase (oxaloacetate-decarboxylating)(NADP+)